LNNPLGGHSGLSFVHRAPLVVELLDAHPPSHPSD
jgi:hypothetical protein